MKGVYWILRGYVLACGLAAFAMPYPLWLRLAAGLLLLVPNRLAISAPWIQIRLLLCAALFCGLVWLSAHPPWSGHPDWAPLARLGLMTLGAAAPLTLLMRLKLENVSPFRSNEELFQAVEGLIARLEESQAAQLKEGFSCLNGLTDGWALFLESIEKVRRGRLDPEDRKALERIRKAVRAAVYR